MRSDNSTPDKVQSLIDSIEPGINQALRSTEDYAKHLRFVAALPHYSLNNCILIESQLLARGMEPDVVMSFTGWKSVDRHVNEGEKGLMILAPCPKNIRVSEPLLDEDGNEKLDRDGNVMTHMIEKTVMRYKVTYTFAKSQTSGAEIPDTVHLLTGDVAGYEDIMEAIKKIAPAEVRFEKIDSGANGFYSPQTKAIVISNSLDPKHQVHTAFHELGHAIADELGIDENHTRAERECEAESISYVLLNHALAEQVTPEELGTYTFGYIDSWSPDADLKSFRSMLDNIRVASCELITRYDRALEEVVLERTPTLAFKTHSGYLFVDRIDEMNVEYSLFDSDYHLLDGGVHESAERIDIVSNQIMEYCGIPSYELQRISVEDLQIQLDMAHDRRDDLATDIANLLNKEYAEYYASPIPKQLIFAQLENGSADKAIEELMRLARLHNEDAMALVDRLEMDGMKLSGTSIEATPVTASR